MPLELRDIVRNNVKEKFARDEVVASMTVRFAKSIEIARIAREGPERVWQNTMEGEERELHYGSTGKVFLAFGSQKRRERFFSQEEPYTKLTPYTLTTAQQVWDEVEKVMPEYETYKLWLKENGWRL